MVLQYLFSLCKMSVYIICQFNPTAYSFLHVYIFQMNRDYCTSVTHSLTQMVPGIEHFAFLNWIDYFLVKEPKQMNSKWCDLSNSQKHNDFSRKSYFCWRSFQKKIFIYLKSQFSHANLLFELCKESSCGIASYFFITDISISLYFFLISFSVPLSSCKSTNIGSRPNF